MILFEPIMAHLPVPFIFGGGGLTYRTTLTMSISVTLFNYKVQCSIVALQGGQKWYHIPFAGYVLLNAHTPYP